MKKIMYLLSIMILACLVACSTSYQNESEPQEKVEKPAAKNNVKKALYKKITPKEAKKLIDEEKVVILDVRTEEEFNQGYIPGATLIPVDELEDKVENEIKDKDTIILVYCRAGNRSEKASKTLVDLGYKNVYDIGGIEDWPYDIVQPN